MKQGVWKSDWFVGLVITIVFLAFMRSNFIQSIERNAYDFGVQSSNRTASDKIAVIAIDDESIANLGRWPWSRNIHAQMQELLTKGGAKAIGQTVFFTEPQLDPGLQFIRELKSNFDEGHISGISQYIKDLDQIINDSRLLVKNKRDANGQAAIDKIKEYVASSPLQNQLLEEIAAYKEYIASAEAALDADKTLATSMQQTGNVVLAMPFILGEPIGRPDQNLPEYVQRNKLPESNIIDDPTSNPDGWQPLSMIDGLPPIPAIGEIALNIGALVSVLDVDGGIRSEPLVVDYYGDFYPSVALILAAKSLNLSIDDIKVTVSSDVQLGRLTIKTDEESQMKTFFYTDVGYNSAFPVDSFYDVIKGKIPANKYKDKIVLIGATAFGVGNTMVTPIDPAMSPVLTLAHSISSILNEDFFVEPSWAAYAQLAALFLVALYLMLLLPRMGAAAGFIITIFLFTILFITHYVLMTTQGMWVQLMSPSLLLVIGHILLTTKRYLLTERGKARLDIESAESNRMLGLSMQGQGQLDMAFEKFRKLPADKSALELLYNLALDYERKRQFNKAKSVYNYIADHDANFRDIKTRSTRATAMDETVMLGGGSSSPGGTLVLNDGSIEKPMLGRYQIERELGKGAMGAVYLGKDPKISRVVAIKTMALSQEFEEDELKEVKERFFREAETAGRLNHPNIVTIYDAGDEHDLAYIAMEYLKGTDLVKYIKKDNLLPLTKVLSLMQQAAEGLGYAHSFNVVHRDIKPANIMWDPESGSLKITDFGIARITDSSKTKTGMVLGTPSYMSPEQLAGKRVEGQSDLFSLGVMLFQMVTGQLPFVGDSMAALMYKIANEAHPSPESINPSVPRCVSVIINRALQKDIEKRYQTGKQMADDIGKCLRIMAAEGKA
ncbi:MAG: CHASE2 domain-containing protein [Gammaproteobacteria bacterium]|nr:CHASE2 domain-containing protein [Gammaproteobacteria bacterium]